MHNGFVQVNQEKMSKSLGNFFTVRDVLKEVYPDELRWFIVASHYRSPLNYSDQELMAARAALTRLYTALRGVEPRADDAATHEYAERFEAAMNADLNTPEAIAVLFDIARDLNRAKEAGETAQAGALAARLKGLAGLLGLLGEDPETWLRRPARPGAAGALDDAAITALVEERNAARASKDWKRADALRQRLAEQGIVLEDSAGRTTWRRG
jgi:cysteinyl-tRNA synthetase